MGDKGALALMGMYGSDSEDEGCNDANGAHDRAPPGETRGAHGGHDSDSEEGVDILGAIAAATENAADGRSPAKQQNGEDEGTTAEPAAEAEPPEEPMEEEAPVPRRQCVSIPAKFMEGVEILAAPEGEVAPETLNAVRECLTSLRTRPGVNLNHEFRKSQGFRNPDFLERLADGTNIVDYGTNFAPEVFDPTPQHPEDFFDALHAAQKKAEQEARAKQQALASTATPQQLLGQQLALAQAQAQAGAIGRPPRGSKWGEPVMQQNPALMALQAQQAFQAQVQAQAAAALAARQANLKR